ncbi:hypothetical protein [Crassaminicella indica]|uniref:Uncharacterized protein n=1 Tax=Crassaminicella indica TaxID=2855394 RepID=A0ABX8RAN4_9CLOT|nr:hypothetical protein [Crassaminicella indica]QXM06124.1 hypothetical protein KVH43_12345 [Crassaminicella indica]
MKSIKSIPYIVIIVSIFISTTIAMIQNISFSAYLKRTICFYLIIFLSAKCCIYYISKAKELSSNKNIIDMVIPPEEIEVGTDKDEVEDDFIPLDLEKHQLDTNINES